MNKIFDIINKKRLLKNKQRRLITTLVTASSKINAINKFTESSGTVYRVGNFIVINTIEDGFR